MIPKKLHYCWFGVGEIPELSKRCIDSWNKHLSDFEIIRWDETNAPTHIPFVRDMLLQKKWAFASDYVRLHAIYEQGGIYLDTDMLLLKEVDATILRNRFFSAFEVENRVSFGFFGGVNPVILKFDQNN